MNIKTLSEMEALEYVLNYDNNENPDILLNEFKKSGMPLEQFILEVYPAVVHNTGGHCMVSIATLDNGKVCCVTDESLAVFNTVGAFYDYENVIFEIYLNEVEKWQRIKQKHIRH